jgi:hypothetical protein
MTRLLSSVLMLSMAIAVHGEVVDRIAVTIGQYVISEQDLIQDIRISAFLDGKLPDLSGEEKRKAANRLVDQYLVLQDAALTRAPLPGPADVAPLLAPIKARYGSEEEFQAALRSAGITEAGLTEHLLQGLRMLRYTDFRFRPEVELTDQDLRAYYDKMVEEAERKPGQPVPSFEASRDQIEKLLTEQQVMQSLDRWLGMTRSETQILFREDAFQ